MATPLMWIGVSSARRSASASFRPPAPSASQALASTRTTFTSISAIAVHGGPSTSCGLGAGLRSGRGRPAHGRQHRNAAHAKHEAPSGRSPPYPGSAHVPDRIGAWRGSGTIRHPPRLGGDHGEGCSLVHGVDRQVGWPNACRTTLCRPTDRRTGSEVPRLYGGDGWRRINSSFSQRRGEIAAARCRRPADRHRTPAPVAAPALRQCSKRLRRPWQPRPGPATYVSGVFDKTVGVAWRNATPEGVPRHQYHLACQAATDEGTRPSPSEHRRFHRDGIHDDRPQRTKVDAVLGVALGRRPTKTARQSWLNS